MRFVRLLALCVAVFLPATILCRAEELTRFVDPRIGSGDHGHVFIGANVPFGLVQLGPSNISQGWDWCSGYHESDRTIMGFAHLHLNGTGCEDLGDILLLPLTGEVTLARGTHDDPQSGTYSRFDRATEQVRPGFYSVRLERYGVDAALTATARVGLHRYTFPKGSDARVLIDLEHAVGGESFKEGFLVRESDTVVSGYRFSKGWANNQKIFFTITFSRPMKGWLLSEGAEAKPGDELKGAKVYGQALFDAADGEAVMAKVALSPVSIDNAKKNMQAELPGWDFDATVRKADEAWERELSRIRIETPDHKIKRIFYTALYHTMIAPSVFCDVNGDYRGADGQMHANPGYTTYTTFSLWDTYRAAHPLMTIIHPERVPDMINTMLAIHREQGKLPVWHLMGCETNCMVGNGGICVVADAVMKDFEGFDHVEALAAMKASAMLDERGLKWLKQYGYIPYDKEGEGLSKCMEYALADWSIAQAAQKLDRHNDAAYFLERSGSWRHYFDPETGFVRGKSSDGKFRERFNPFESVHRDNDYTEGNAWQYTWLVPHDIPGLVKAFGGREAFIAKLDELFTAEGDLGAQASPDISGMIGQYAHGNEPSHHILYIYPYVGQPWKTAQRVRQVLDTLYSDEPAGLCGNEDVGQMSAWYIFSALGFYQVEPAGGKYVLGSPVIDRAVINTGRGRTFEVVVHNNSPKNIYIQRVTLNGREHPLPWLDFKDISRGGRLEITMGGKPSPTWGIIPESDTL